MEPNNNTTPIIKPAPEIPESEMKLPEEQFGQQNQTISSSHHFNPLLIILLVILLVVLGVVVIWGEQLVKLIFMEPTIEQTPINEDATETVTESDISRLENELDEVDSLDFESELDAIDAELDADLSTTSTSSEAAL